MEEERYNGTIALEVLNGLKMPLFYYQHQPYAPGAMFEPYAPGTVVVGLLSTPFFLIFGASYISLKIVALLFSLGSFILWYLFLCKFFNSRVAITTAFLFILSPPNNIKFSLLSFGNHYEINFFTILSLYIFYNIFFPDVIARNEATKQSLFSPNLEKGSIERFEIATLPTVARNDISRQSENVNFFLLGLICGFASYFALTFFATLLTLLIFWFIFDKKLFIRKSFLIFFVSFLIGFSPWIYNTISFKLGSLDFHGKPIYLLENSEAYLTKLFRMVVTGIPFSLGFEGIKGTTLDAYIYSLIVIISFGFLLKINSNYFKKVLFGIFPLKRFRTSPQELSKETLLLFFPILYCLLFTILDFKVPQKLLSEAFILRAFDNFFYLAYRYFIPLFPFLFVFIALFSDRLWNSERHKSLKKGLSISILTIVFLLCGLSYLKLVRPVDFGKGFFYSGSDYFIMGEKFAERFKNNSLGGIQLIEKLEPQYKIVALRGFGHYFGENKDFLPDFLEKIKGLDERLKIPLYRGAAKGMFSYLKLDKTNLNFLKTKDNEPVDILKLIEKVDEKHKNLFYRELGNFLKRDIHISTDKEMIESLRLINHFNKDYQPEFHNLEIEYGGKNISSWIERINHIPENYRGYFFKALGKGMAWFLWYQEEEFKKEAEKIPEEYRMDFYEGLGLASGSFFAKELKRAIKIVESLDSKYSTYCYRALGEALFWECGYNLNKAITLINSIDQKDKRYCYIGLGRGIGYMLWWNPDKINKLLNMIEEPYRDFCERGIRRRIREDFLLSKQNYFNYFHLKIRY